MKLILVIAGETAFIKRNYKHGIFDMYTCFSHMVCVTHVLIIIYLDIQSQYNLCKMLQETGYKLCSSLEISYRF